MYVDTLLRSQFGKPSGLFGAWFMRPILNLANAWLVDAAIELLDPQARDRILDIGFGGGHSLLALARKASRARVVGVDYSREMVEAAARMIREKQLTARLSVRWGDVARLPFRAGIFDKVLTVNSLYYWRDLEASLREVSRVMKPGGRLAAGFRSPDSLRAITRGWDAFSLYEPREVARIMRRAGFHVARVEHRDQGRALDTVVVLGEKRAVRQRQLSSFPRRPNQKSAPPSR